MTAFNVRLVGLQMDFYGKEWRFGSWYNHCFRKSGLESLKAKNNYTAYDNSLSETTGKRGLFNYLEATVSSSYHTRPIMNGSKTNTKATLLAKSDVPEARESQGSRELRASTLSVCTTRLLQIVGTQGRVLPLLPWQRRCLCYTQYVYPLYGSLWSLPPGCQ